jgi:hypothetical protein
LFGERPHPTCGVATEEAAHRQAQFHQPARDRQISQPTLIPRMHPPRRHRAPRAALLGAARRRMKNDTNAGTCDLVDLYAVKMRQQPADDLITPSTQRSTTMNIDHSSRDRTDFRHQLFASSGAAQFGPNSTFSSFSTTRVSARDDVDPTASTPGDVDGESHT